MKHKLEGARALVLGGNGFIGKNLVKALVREGARVRVFDKSIDPRCLPNQNIEYEVGDFSDGTKIRDALAGVDFVYHLVSTTLPSTSNASPSRDVEENLIGTLRLLQKMRDAEVRRIIFVSSGGTVYGNPIRLPVDEDHPLRPISSYGIVKVAIENYLHLYSTLHGFTASVLRVSNPYGIHQQHIGSQGVISTFFNKLIAGERIEIWGDGRSVRDYIYIGDVVTALILAAKENESAVYNIGSGMGHSVVEVLSIISSIVGRNPDVIYSAGREFDVTQTYLDITKARRRLGWSPEVSLEQGCALYFSMLDKAK